MKALFDPAKQHLIIAPLRCGSTMLEENAHQYGLINISAEINENQENFINIVKNSKKKTFLFKEPFERLTSFYRNFVYVPFFWGHDDGLDEGFRKFFPKRRKKDFWDDMLEAKDLIMSQYKNDPHIMPQYTFFDTFNQDVDEYEILNMECFQKWMYLNFSEVLEDRVSPIHEIPIKFSSITKIKELHDMCKVLYKEDYDYLEPNMIYL